MKHIVKFVEYLYESKEWSKEELEEFLIPFKHIDVDYNIQDTGIITEGKYIGRKMTGIFFKTDYKESEILTSTTKISVIDNDSIWELLDEIVTLRNRLESDRVFIRLQPHLNYITIYYIHGESETESDLFKLKQLYSKINGVLISSKTEFANNTVLRLHPDEKKIVVSCHHDYSDRKWNIYTKNIDFSDFKITKEVTGDHNFVELTIEIKDKN